MISGTFHAGPHPGNVLVLSGARLALIDFGSAAGAAWARKRHHPHVGR
jgi:predicted unusual protein kinase regulating ubiquinone biosynthesis (AarF/ABC1/UbiB family)